jgi:hypothetical protein
LGWLYVAFVIDVFARRIVGCTCDGSAPSLANRLAYVGAIMVSTTALGAIATQGKARQGKQVSTGKDPIDMRARMRGSSGPRRLRRAAASLSSGTYC